MKYMRLYAGADGESHVQEMTAEFAPVEYAPPAPPIDVSAPVAAARYVMVRFPAGWDSDLHPAPRRQLFVVFSGRLEGVASDGSAEIFGPGDALLMEDITGKGHSARVIGDSEVLGLMVHLE